MPASENERRNQQAPVLENPSLPDHDRSKDPGMHSVLPDEFNPDHDKASSEAEPGVLDSEEIAPPDQEFGQILASGPLANHGKIPEDPNNWLTSDKEKVYQESDPENRGDSLPDILEKTQH